MTEGLTLKASLAAQSVKNPPARDPPECGQPVFDPWVGKSPGEGNVNQLQYSWVSLVAQMVKNPPAMQET